MAIGLSLFLVENFLTESLAAELAFANFVTAADVFAVTPYVLGLGAILAVLASSISTFRHLRT